MSGASQTARGQLAERASAARPLDLDGRAFLADAFFKSAITQAELAFVGVRGAAVGHGTADETATLIEACGMALMDLWADLMACTGQDRECWARDAALRAVRAYAGRLGELIAVSVEGGRS